MPSSFIIVGIGEALFDIYPDGRRLGGAPLNVAVHAHQLGNTGIVVSRVGSDALGDQIAAALRDRGMTQEHLQRDPDRPTGTVTVEPDSGGFTITSGGVAWDNLQWDGDLDHLAAQCHAVCFGTLAQREAQTQNVIYRFLEAAHRAVRLFDVNLRSPGAPGYDRRSLAHSLELSTAAKLNRAELHKLAELLDLPADEDQAARQLIRRHSLQWLALTRGPEGTVVYTADAKYETPPVPASNVIDTVGAGDAASAAMLHGVLRRWPWDKTLNLANTLGAHVASQPGACPPLNDEIRKLAQ